MKSEKAISIQKTQVMLRSTKAQKAYGYLFEFVNEDSIKLRIINQLMNAKK